MADQTERIILEVDEKGAIAAVSSTNKQVAGLEVAFARAGQTADQRLLAKIATLQQKMSGDPLRLKELDTLQQRVMARMGQGLDGSGSKWQQLGAKIKDAIQNPLQAAGNAAEGLVSKLGPVGGIAVAAAAGIAAMAKTGFDAMKSLGSFAIEVEHTAVRMGLSIQETMQFRFAMQYAGGEMSSLEGITRKLSQEIDAGGSNLREMGISTRDAMTGGLRPMSEVILDIATRLRDMPDVAQRNATAIKILGRAAMEVLPDLMELPQGVARANELGIGVSEELIRKAREYQHEIAEVDAKWEALKRTFKEPIAATVNFVFKNMGMVIDIARAPYAALFSGKPTAADIEMQETGGYGYGASESREGHRAEVRSKALNNRLIDALVTSTPEERLALAKTELAKRKDDLEKLRDVFPSQSEDARKLYAEQQGAVKALEAGIKAPKLATEAAKNQRDWFLKLQKWREKRLDEAVNEGTKSAPDPAGLAADNLKNFEEFQNQLRFERKAEGERQIEILNRQSKEAGGATSHQERMSELTTRPGQELPALQQAYALRVQSIEAERKIAEKEADIAAQHGIVYDIDQKRWELQQQMQEAGYQYEEKVAQLQRSRLDQLRSSMEGLLDAAFTKSKGILALKSMAEAVFLTPIKQGISTLMAQALMPVMYGKDGNGGIMGAITGIFNSGSSGIGNVKLINGAVPVVITGGSSAPGGVQSSYVLPALGGAALGGLLASGGSTMSRANEVLGGGSSTAGLTQLSSGLWQRGPEAVSSVGQIVGGPGGTSGFSGPLENNPMINYDAWGQGAAQGVPPGGGGILQNLSGLGGLKGILSKLGSIGMKPDRYAMDEGGNMTKIAGAKGVGGVTGGAMLLGGGVLAADGLRRGGWAGVGETTAGGALIGAKFGGPLGAAIGGGIGFLAGLVRLGIKSAAEKVMEKVRTLYGISIDKKTAQQIVEIANQKYAKNLDMAVRAPEVRELLKLYAQTMGQKVPAALMADQARSASLIESRGQLYQGAQYDNGQAYSYASSLKTYGGVQTSALPTASPSAGAVNVYLNPQQTVDLWKTGTTQAMQGNPRLVSASALRGNQASATRGGFTSTMLAPSVIAQ